MTTHTNCKLCKQELAKLLHLLAKLAALHVNGYFTNHHEALEYRGRLWLLERPQLQIAALITKEWLDASMPNLEAAAASLAEGVRARVGSG